MEILSSLSLILANDEAEIADASPNVEAMSSESELSDSEYDSDLERLRSVGDVPVPRYSNSDVAY